MTSGFSTSAINPHPSTLQALVPLGHRCQTSTGGCGCIIPHTHLAHFIPNQHTLTCRSINDLVLKQPTGPQIGNVLGSQPFLPPIGQVYLEPCDTTGCCKAEIPFHNLFATKVHLLSPQHIRTRERLTRGQCSLSAPGEGTYSSFNPCSHPHYPLAGSFQLPFM